MHVQLQTPETPETPETVELGWSTHERIFRSEAARKIRGYESEREVIKPKDIERIHRLLDELVHLEDKDLNFEMLNRFGTWMAVANAMKMVAGLPCDAWPDPQAWRDLMLRTTVQNSELSGNEKAAERPPCALDLGHFDEENYQLWPSERDIRGIRHHHKRMHPDDVETLHRYLNEILEIEDTDLNACVISGFSTWRALLVALKVSRGIPTPEWPEPALWFAGCHHPDAWEPRLLKEGQR